MHTSSFALFVDHLPHYGDFVPCVIKKNTDYYILYIRIVYSRNRSKYVYAGTYVCLGMGCGE